MANSHFDTDKLIAFAESEIKKFIASHKDETFYGFAIDARQLCFNSEEEFTKTLNEYRRKSELKNSPIKSLDDLEPLERSTVEHEISFWGRLGKINPDDLEESLDYINKLREERANKKSPYDDPKNIEELRNNTGDWTYFGFSEFTSEVGFDEDAYQEHYNLPDKAQRTSVYGKAMDKVIHHLLMSDIFDDLKYSDDFRIRRVEHNY